PRMHEQLAYQYGDRAARVASGHTRWPLRGRKVRRCTNAEVRPDACHAARRPFPERRESRASDSRTLGHPGIPRKPFKSKPDGRSSSHDALARRLLALAGTVPRPRREFMAKEHAKDTPERERKGRGEDRTLAERESAHGVTAVPHSPFGLMRRL